MHSPDDITACLPMVRREAGRLAARLPANVERDDLVQAGSLAVVQAAGRYEPARGIPFAAYALPSIRGAMLDALRADDMLSRVDRKRVRDGAAPAPVFVCLDEAASVQADTLDPIAVGFARRILGSPDRLREAQDRAADRIPPPRKSPPVQQRAEHPRVAALRAEVEAELAALAQQLADWGWTPRRSGAVQINGTCFR